MQVRVVRNLQTGYFAAAIKRWYGWRRLRNKDFPNAKVWCDPRALNELFVTRDIAKMERALRNLAKACKRQLFDTTKTYHL